MARETDIARRDDRLVRPQPFSNPFRMLERFADEMDQVFDEFGLGRGWMTPRFGRNLRGMGARSSDWTWTPDIEVFQRGNEIVVHADLPGLKKDEIKVDVDEDRITLQGERRREREEERDGIYRSERSYGTFYREIPLPPGTMADQAKASFRDGVLEITIPAPPEAARHGRRLEISEAAPVTKPVVQK